MLGISEVDSGPCQHLKVELFVMIVNDMQYIYID